MKKMLYSLLAIITVCAVLCGLLYGCAVNDSDDQVKRFSTNEEFADYVQKSYWVSQSNDADTVHYILCCFTDESCVQYDLSRESGVTLTDMFEQMLLQLHRPGQKLVYEDVYNFLASAPAVDGLKCTTEQIRYAFEEKRVYATSGTAAWRFYGDHTMNHYNDYYTQTEKLSELENAFDEACNEAALELFLRKYPNAPSGKDVKYDPYSYLGKNLVVTGIAELDDYYNFEYRDHEASCFCIAIEPANGSYSDRWYIYADRSAFRELFQTLKDGNGTAITLVCRAEFSNATKNSMATLVDYYIR